MNSKTELILKSIEDSEKYGTLYTHIILGHITWKDIEHVLKTEKHAPMSSYTYDALRCEFGLTSKNSH